MDLSEYRKERWWARVRRAARLVEEHGRRRAGDSGGGGERRAGEAERERSLGSGFFLIFPTCGAKQEELWKRIRGGAAGSGGVWQRSSASHAER
jgi:hypothetical protein